MENMSVHLLTNSNSILPIANANKILPIDTVPTNNFTDEFLMSHLPNFGRGERITSKDYKFPSFKSFHQKQSFSDKVQFFILVEKTGH